MDMLNEWLTNQPGHARSLAEEELIVDVSEEIWAALNGSGLSKAELAERLDVSRPRITNLLNGSANMTLRTLADIAYELGKRVSVSLQDRHVVNWKPQQESHRVVQLQAIPHGARQCTVSIAKWCDVNDNRYENADESIAA